MNRRAKHEGKNKHSAGPLLSPEGTGGLVAGGGFDFQDRYAVCHLPVWLKGDFNQMLYEGTGDIDVRFGTGGPSSRVHIQVKDHEVVPAELKAAVARFAEIDAEMPGVYQRFTIACPSLSATLRSLETGLARFRNVKPFYDDVGDALTSTRDEVVRRLEKAGLKDHVEFVLEKLEFDVGHSALRHDDGAIELFISRMLSHPIYATKLREMVLPAFAELARAVVQHRGKVIDRQAIERILKEAVRSAPVDRPSVTLWFHNWTREEFEVPADSVIDWSDRFDRATRRVPPPEAWSEALLPELRHLRQSILAGRVERVIRFRGKCALSSAWLIGSVFPIVGGWAFEIPQPPGGVWKSDDPPAVPYASQISVADADPSSSELVLVVNVRGEARDDVSQYVERAGLRPRITVTVSPPSTGAQGIRGSEEACAFANAVREEVGAIIKQYGIRRTHVFYYGPLALAVFLGQRFTAVGEIRLYEYQDPGYAPTCAFAT